MRRHGLDAIVAPSGGPAWPIDRSTAMPTGAAIRRRPRCPAIPVSPCRQATLGAAGRHLLYRPGPGRATLIRLAYAFEQATQAWFSRIPAVCGYGCRSIWLLKDGSSLHKLSTLILLSLSAPTRGRGSTQPVRQKVSTSIACRQLPGRLSLPASFPTSSIRRFWPSILTANISTRPTKRWPMAGSPAAP